MDSKNSEQAPGWRFTSPNGEFILEEPQRVRDLYFPLANEAGLMSSITPLLHGDIKTSQHSFLTPPVSSEDLQLSRAGRNFWVYLEGFGPWSATGNSARQVVQNSQESSETVTMEGGFLWHQITRVDKSAGVAAEIVNFVPTDDASVELMRVKFTNLRNTPMTIVPTAAIPLYGRSADNLRDHRHVTSLLNRICTSTFGVELQPTFCFDERGHTINRTVYSIIGADETGNPPVGFFPLLAEFMGEGGVFDWPEAVVKNRVPQIFAGRRLEGYEALGGLRFRESILAPGASKSFILGMAITNEPQTDHCAPARLAAKYCSGAAFEEAWNQNKAHWNQKLNRLSFEAGDSHFNAWLRWVNLQPILRRIYGCSFLPHHDYGKGGRGWRDLWQDCLALLFLEPAEVETLLYHNFAGVRIDGSNATIIGTRSGEFCADRNNIIRVWMDHGAWPFFTTRLYLDQSGDLEFLLKEQTYFKDHRICRARSLDPDWTPADGNLLRQADSAPYQGSILEHLLVELVTIFYNVGSHNLMKLEDADWNDGLDMAGNHGESVAFTAFYAWNLSELSRLLLDLQRKLGAVKVDLAAELLPLFDTLQGGIDYDSIPAKQDLLHRYFDTVKHTISGKKVPVDLMALSRDLRKKADWIGTWIRDHEWLANFEGYQWFNGYYDDDGRRVEGDHPSGVRMTLTGQVFPIMSGIASREQVIHIIQAVDHYLKDPIRGGYRLNTDFGGIQPKLGRAFAFAYGHKENGAIFSHMAVMYSYALYHRGFVREGFSVLKSLYDLSVDFQNSRIYPGIPEYFNNQGRGMYHYLTGSASWYVMTLVTEVFGVRGCRGDLLLQPKLLGEQFDGDGIARVTTTFAGRELEICYHNPGWLDFNQYRIVEILLDDQEIGYQKQDQVSLIPRKTLLNLDSTRHRMMIQLR